MSLRGSKELGGCGVTEHESRALEPDKVLGSIGEF